MHCSCVDAFRHRADAILVDRPAVGYRLPGLTLTRLRTPRACPCDCEVHAQPVEKAAANRPCSTMFNVKGWPPCGAWQSFSKSPEMRTHTTILAMIALAGFSTQLAAQERCGELSRLRSEAAEAAKRIMRVRTQDRCEAYIRFSESWRELARYAGDHRELCEISDASLSDIEKRHREAVKARDSFCTH